MADPSAPIPQDTAPPGKTILHVSSAHRASDGRIARKEADALSRAGYDVTVMALDRAAGTSLPDGPRFIELGPPTSRPRRFLLRLPWLLAYCIRNRYDAYHLHDPDLVLLGFALKALGRQVIYDVHEAFPMVILDRAWIPRPLRPILSRAWRHLEGSFVKVADLTITAHDTVKDQFRSGTVVTVRNFPIIEDMAPAPPQPMAQRPWRVIYHGDLTEQRGLVTMIEAIGKVAGEPTAELRLGGSLAPDLAERIAAMPSAKRTAYLGWLNQARLAGELAQARAGLVLLHPTNNYLMIRPNKLYEYMAAGLPVIASDFPHWREVVAGTGCGLLVDPQDPAAIAAAIETIFADPEEAAAMGRRGQQAVLERYNWQCERQRLLAGYRLVFAPDTHPAR